MTVKIEVIAVPGCKQCTAAQAELRTIASVLLGEENIVWREVNVLKEIDYAVSLGVLSTPAIAVNGELVFSSLPTPAQFRTLLTRLEPR